MICKRYAIFLIIFICWCLCSYHFKTPNYLLPSPDRVYSTFINLINNGELIKHIIISLKRVFIGFSIAFLISVICASLQILLPKAFIFYEKFLAVFRYIPPLSIMGLLILYFGIEETPKIIIIALACFFPIYLSLQKGLVYSDNNLIEVGKVYGLNNYEIFMQVIIKNARSDIFNGASIGIGYAFRAIVAAEMLGASTGVGYLINDAFEMSNSSRLFVGIFTILFLSFIVEYILLQLAKYYKF